jgi:Amt family ammonium transporter
MRFTWMKLFFVLLVVGLAAGVLAGRVAVAQAPAADAAPATAGASGDRVAALEKQVADQSAAIASAQTAGDNAWMLVSAALVLMMSGPGLALFYGGLVRRKNVLGTMMQTFAMMAVITMLWAVVSYSLAFGSGNAFIGGLHNVFLHGVGLTPDKDYAATIPLQTFMVYQLMFAIITPALITGAFAERMKFSAMLVFMILWAICVYSPMAHMVWGKGGLLNASLGGKFPCLDFAGGTVVHVTSGVSALVTALYLGKRLGYPKVPMPPHSVVLSFIGACLLWVGWFGFNAGSALAAGTLATSAFVATHFGAAAAAVGWSAAEWIRNGKPSALGAISGCVAGLVAITPASGFVTPMGALWIGLIAGVFCFLMVVKVKAIFGYDDSLDAFGVHRLARRQQPPDTESVGGRGHCLGTFDRRHADHPVRGGQADRPAGERGGRRDGSRSLPARGRRLRHGALIAGAGGGRWRRGNQAQLPDAAAHQNTH